MHTVTSILLFIAQKFYLIEYCWKIYLANGTTVCNNQHSLKTIAQDIWKYVEPVDHAKKGRRTPDLITGAPLAIYRKHWLV